MRSLNIKEEDLPALLARLCDRDGAPEPHLQNRHLEIIPPPEKAQDPRKYWKYQLILAANIMHFHLETLRGWTAYWEKYLPVLGSESQVGDIRRDPSPPEDGRGSSQPSTGSNPGPAQGAKTTAIAPIGQSSSEGRHNKHSAQYGHSYQG